MVTKRGFITCGCGFQVKVIRYENGKKVCQRCSPQNLSGNFLRRMEGEKQYYSKDLLQPGQEGFEELYGKGRNIRPINP